MMKSPRLRRNPCSWVCFFAFLLRLALSRDVEGAIPYKDTSSVSPCAGEGEEDNSKEKARIEALPKEKTNECGEKNIKYLYQTIAFSLIS